MATALIKQQISNDYPTIERGQGVWLYDTNGKSYIDGSSGAMTANIGHGVSRIAEVMRKQAETVAFTFRTQFTNRPAEDLATRLAELAPGDINHVFFVNSGSEASEHAMRFALHVWKERDQPQKIQMITRQCSYHGMTLGALSLSGHAARRPDFGPWLHEFPVVPPTYAYRSDWGDLPVNEQCKCADDWEKAILAAGPENVAAVMLEPIVGAAGGVLMPPKGYMKRVREICDRHNVLMIVDEVITGMGRTGAWFTSAQEGVVPDIITTAKGLSAGFTPLGAVMIRTPLIESIKAGSGQAPFGHTFSGNPLSTAVCLSVIDYIEDNNVIENVNARGLELEAGLRALSQRYKHMVDVRGRGLLWGFEFVMDRESRIAPPVDFNAAGKFTDLCQTVGLIVYAAGIAPYNNAAIVSPPLVITIEELQELLNRLDSALAKMEAELNAISAE